MNSAKNQVPYGGRTGKEGDSEPRGQRLLANSQPLVRRKCSFIVGGNQQEGKKKRALKLQLHSVSGQNMHHSLPQHLQYGEKDFDSFEIFS
ncbi:uncharacterized protein LOC120012274 isoform X2 [Tripterygium wilfordii]|uniref:uncharacterized protein LOC120012274 isoform X2 n=1 Tax=Tripterygium wilfordii TaxID=458696 RepID=UPI0018F8194C|nr:uncharacterized protein LOC120012274 isoform X2 [Tripterygium wilfordii]